METGLRLAIPMTVAPRTAAFDPKADTRVLGFLAAANGSKRTCEVGNLESHSARIWPTPERRCVLHEWSIRRCRSWRAGSGYIFVLRFVRIAVNLEAHRKYIKHHGPHKFLFYVLYRILERTLGFKALRGLTLTMDTVDPVFLKDHPVLPGEAVRGSDLQLLIDEPVDITADFISRAIERDDWCFVFRDGANIASYSWYTAQTCPVLDNVAISFFPSYLYMYKGFTDPAYRGQRLHAYGMASALNKALNEGYKGLIGYVEAHNAPSLKSGMRLGYRVFGTCFLIRVLGHAFTVSTPGCRQYGFYLETTRSES